MTSLRHNYNHKRIFRVLLLSSPLLALAGEVINTMYEHHLPKELRMLRELYEAYPLTIWDYASFVLVIAFLVVLVGLFYFKHWARTGNLVVGVLFSMLMPLLQFDIYLPLALLFIDTATALWGAVTAMTFLPPLKDAFTLDRTSQG